MSSASSIALSGLTAASTRLDAHAQNVANLQSDGYAPVDVTQEALPQGGTVATVSRPSPGELASDAALVRWQLQPLARVLARPAPAWRRA